MNKATLLTVLLFQVTLLFSQKAIFSEINYGAAFTNVEARFGSNFGAGIGYLKRGNFVSINYASMYFTTDDSNYLKGNTAIFDKDFENFPFQNEKNRNRALAKASSGYRQLYSNLFTTMYRTIGISVGKYMPLNSKFTFGLGVGLKNTLIDEKIVQTESLTTINYLNQQYNFNLIIPSAFKFYDFGAVFNVSLGYKILDGLDIEVKLRMDKEFISSYSAYTMGLGIRNSQFLEK